MNPDYSFSGHRIPADTGADIPIEDGKVTVIKSSTKNKSVAMAVLVALANCISGCSVVGLGVGLAIDGATKDEKAIDKYQCGEIKCNTKTVFHLNNGSTISGLFDGLENKREEEYNSEYIEFTENHKSDIFLPAIGDTLRIVYIDGYRGWHEFLGFDCSPGLSGKLMKESKRFSCACISTNELGSNVKKEYLLEYLQEIKDNNGHSATGEELGHLILHTSVPLRSRMAIIGDSGFEYVTIEEVASIDIPRSKNAKWIGLGIGLFIDWMIGRWISR